MWLKDGSVFFVCLLYKNIQTWTYMGENPSRIIIQNQFTGVNVATAKERYICPLSRRNQVTGSHRGPERRYSDLHGGI